MQFAFNLFNHSEVGKRSLEDVIGIMGHQLRALGHRAVWDPKRDQDFLHGSAGINIIVEGFNDWSTACLAEMVAGGGRFIILATEEPIEGKGFNHGTQPEMVKRQNDFGACARLSEGIVHLVPGDHVTKWYGQFAPTAYAELGYAPSLVRIKPVNPTYEFGFYGSMSPRRFRLLKKLANATNKQRGVRVVGDFQEQIPRDEAMRDAKVIIQIRKFEPMGLVSSSRCATALCLGRPVVAEQHDLSKPWDEIVPFAQTEKGFINLALMTAATWRGAWRDQFDKFKEMMTPEHCIGRALDQIGILKPKENAA